MFAKSLAGQIGTLRAVSRSPALSRCMSLNLNPGNPETPGYEPSVGNRVTNKVRLHPAKTWDQGAADKFKSLGYEELFSKKKVVLFSLPGAFTGVCSGAHVPSYSKHMDAFKAKGIDQVMCVSVNDPYTMNAWKEKLGDKAKGIDFFGDADGTFTHFMHKEIDLTPAGLGPGLRSTRYSMMLEDGIIKHMFVEKAPSDMELSSGDNMIKALK